MFNRLRAIFKRMRQEPVADRPPVYMGNKKSGLYHRNNYEYAMMMRKGRRILHTQHRATEEGYVPCKICQPDRNPFTSGEWTPDFWGDRG